MDDVKGIIKYQANLVRRVADMIDGAREPKDLSFANELLMAKVNDLDKFISEWKDMVEEVEARNRNEEAIANGEARYRQSVLGDEA